MEKQGETISFLECIRVLFITLMDILIPSAIIGGLIYWLAPLNLILSGAIGIGCTVALIFLLGFHKPATENEFSDNDDEDDDD